MQNWENPTENPENEPRPEEKKDTLEADFTVKENTETEPCEEKKEERPVYAFETLYKETQMKKARKKSGRISGGAVAAIVALCLVVSILSGVFAGALFTGQFAPNETVGTTLPDESSPVSGHLTESTADSAPTSTEKAPLIVPTGDGSGKALSPEDIAEKCMDSVVIINVITVTTYTYGGQRFEQPSAGAGSGVIYSSDGYIITNYHVANPECTNITVTTNRGEEYEAKYILGDADADVALLKIDAKGLKPAIVGSSATLQVANYVAAIGNPLSMGLSFTDGKISALSRKIAVDGSSMNLIQTTAPINAGNSGGGLFNVKGELVGIVNAKLVDSSVEGFGFAIPIDTVVETLNDLRNYGYVRGRARLGLTFNSVYLIDGNAGYSFFSDYTVAICVYSVTKGGNAEKAGIQTGDILYKINGKEVTSSNIATLLSAYSIGDTVDVTVLRQNQPSSSPYVYIQNCTEVTMKLTFEEFDPNAT